MVDFKCIEAIVRAIKKEFPDMSCYTHGYSDGMRENYFRYYDKSKYNRFNCFVPQIFKGGFCNNYDEVTKTYKLGNVVHIRYAFPSEEIQMRVWKIADKVAKKHGYVFVGGIYEDSSCFVADSMKSAKEEGILGESILL